MTELLRLRENWPSGEPCESLAEVLKKRMRERPR